MVPNDVRYQAALHSDMAASSGQRGYIRATVAAQAFAPRQGLKSVKTAGPASVATKASVRNPAFSNARRAGSIAHEPRGRCAR